MNKNNNTDVPTKPAAKPLPTLVVWAITLVATLVAVGEALAGWFVAIRKSPMSLRRKLAHGVAAVVVTSCRAVDFLRGARASRAARPV